MTEQQIITAIESSVQHTTVSMDVMSDLIAELSKYSIHTFGAKIAVESLPGFLFGNHQDQIFDYISQVNAHLAVNGISPAEISLLLERNNILYTNSTVIGTLKAHVVAADTAIKDNVVAILFLLRLYVLDLTGSVSKRKIKENNK